MKRQKAAVLILIALIVFVTISYLSYPLVGPDSGYYLSTAREFYSGKIYFVNIATPYNPLGVIVLGLPYLFQINPDPRWSLLINFMVIWASAYILFSIFQKINDHKSANLFYSLFFVLGSLMLDGSHLMLEPISVFFQLTGFLFYLLFRDSEKNCYLLYCGIAVALSFLSKQYGLFILAPIGIDIVMSRRQILKKSFVIGSGFLIPVLLFFLYLINNNATILQCISYVLGKGIHFDQGSGTGINYSWTTYLIGFGVFLLFNVYVFLIPVLFLKFRKKASSNSLVFISAFPFSLLVLMAASYAHYFQYVLPYALVSMIFLIVNSEPPFVKLKNVFFGLSLLMMLIVAGISFSRKQQKIDLQEVSVTEFSAAIPKKSKVYIDGASPAFYYLCNFQSINLKEIGFTFPGYFYPKTIIEKSEPNSYLLLTKEAYPSYKKWVEGFPKKEIRIQNQLYYIIKTE